LFLNLGGEKWELFCGIFSGGKVGRRAGLEGGFSCYFMPPLKILPPFVKRVMRFNITFLLLMLVLPPV
jgi:hypothetical protein